MHPIARLKKLRRIMTAAKQAEMARLGMTLARAEAELREADRLRSIAANRPAQATAFDMAAQSFWQDGLADRARAADKRRALALAEAEQRRAMLSRAIGREGAVERLTTEAVDEAARERQRREDDTAGWTPPPP